LSSVHIRFPKYSNSHTCLIGLLYHTIKCFTTTYGLVETKLCITPGEYVAATENSEDRRRQLKKIFW